MLEQLEQTELRLELKYCERCGGLWFRSAGADATFCIRCCGQLERDSARLSRRGRRHA